MTTDSIKITVASTGVMSGHIAIFLSRCWLLGRRSPQGSSIQIIKVFPRDPARQPRGSIGGQAVIFNISVAVSRQKSAIPYKPWRWSRVGRVKGPCSLSLASH
jgi:hypothetical protein